MSNSKGSILISNANAVGTALVNKLGGTGYTPNEWSDKINLLGIADADILTALAGITEGSYTGEDRGAIKICNANNVGTMLNKKFNTNRGFKPSEWESAISKLTALTTGTASGSVVTFSDGADDVPVVNCIASVDPVQDLHGYSKPWPAGGGSNLWNEVWELGAINITNGQNVDNNNFIRSKNYISVEPSTTYYKCSPQNILQLYYAIDNSYIGYGSWGKDSTFTTPDNCYFVRFYVAQEYGTTYNNDIAINYPSSVTTYSPYSNICPISGNTETTVYQFGKNLWEFGDRTVDNVAYIMLYFSTPIPAGTYTVSCDLISTTTNCSFRFRKEDGSYLVTTAFTANVGRVSQTLTLPEPAYRVYIYSSTQGTGETTTWKDVQIEVGSTETAYEPYKAKTPINIQFNQTVYGADVDAKSGNNNITRIKNTRTLSEFTKGTSSGGYTAYTLADFFGSGVTVQNNNKQLSNITYYTYTGISLGATHFYIGTNGQMNLYLPDSFTDLTLQIEAVAELTTPQPFTTDPNEISTYKNNNVFYNTTGDTSVTYYKGV